MGWGSWKRRHAEVRRGHAGVRGGEEGDGGETRRCNGFTLFSPFSPANLWSASAYLCVLYSLRTQELLDDLRRVALDHGVWGNIGDNDRAAGDDAGLADCDTGHDDRVDADEAVVLEDHRLEDDGDEARL